MIFLSQQTQFLFLNISSGKINFIEQNKLNGSLNTSPQTKDNDNIKDGNK